MSASDQLVHDRQRQGQTADRLPLEVSSRLRDVYGEDFHLLDARSDKVVYKSTDQPESLLDMWADLWRSDFRGTDPQLLFEAQPFAVLAVPVVGASGRPLVALGMLLIGPLPSEEQLRPAAALVGLSAEEARRWAGDRAVWDPRSVCAVARLIIQQQKQQQRVERLEAEVEQLSSHLDTTYEEISLLHLIAQNLRLSSSDEELARLALLSMEEVVPARSLLAQLLPVTHEDETLSYQARTEPVLLVHGEKLLGTEQLEVLVDHLGMEATSRPVVVNRSVTEQSDWPLAQVRQAIVVPLSEGDNLFGWLAAVNHRNGGEFGTVEASLMSSVSAMLGIHIGNIELYRQQAELLAGIVRALTSAIDAKDPYTCGHSDRVARIAVRLAQELGISGEALNTIYLSGLLHDIGKIGVNDQVLRKPDRLTEEEYEHIKQHVSIGHRILMDLRKLDGVLPVVLHHHESWDGGGYPKKLAAEEIPLPARIVAVADAYDAMGSDRPYRRGLPEEKIDQIFREGAGKQWDPQVVEAFFRVREQLREIVDGRPNPASEMPQLALPGKFRKRKRRQ